MTLDQAIGKRFREARKASGLGVRAFAPKVTCCWQGVAARENGTMHWTADRIAEFSRALGLDPGEVLRGAIADLNPPKKRRARKPKMQVA